MAALKLLWSPLAKNDVRRLRQFIQPKNPAAAQRAAIRILQAADTVADHPEVGRPVDDPEDEFNSSREYIAPFRPGAYILRYCILDEAVLILRIWHSREMRHPS